MTATAEGTYVVAEEPGPWKAVSVYDIFNGPPAVGDKIEVTGIVAEYYGMTELVVDVAFPYQHISSGNDVVATTISPGEVAQEMYESVLIKVENVFVPQLLNFGEWVVADSGGYAICDDLVDYMYFPAAGDQLESVTGIVYFTFGAFKIEPRDTRDIVGDPIPHYALYGHVVTMNHARQVWKSSYVEILGDRIVGIHRRRPRGIPVITVGGLIFPGLIDAHNHPNWNVLDLIPFTKLFEHREEWQNDPLYGEFSDQYGDIRDYPPGQVTNIMKLAEVRAATAGTTMIQGSVTDEDYTRQGIGINNTDRYPTLTFSSVFPLGDIIGEWPFLSTTIFNRFVVHLSEGTNQQALDEFYTWKDSLGMLDSRTSIIHGVPLGPREWIAMGKARAKLIWSPVSNVNLYGATADIPGALKKGVTVALAPDWTESGSPTILDEMKFAYKYNLKHWRGVITPRQMAEFVTRNAAQALGVEDWLGQIAPGYRANLMVIPGSAFAPYLALLHANPADVRLTVVNGRPIYGNPFLMSGFQFLSDTESIYVGGKQKTLALAVDAHAIDDSDKPSSEILAELMTAYEASDPKVTDFLGIE